MMRARNNTKFEGDLQVLLIGISALKRRFNYSDIRIERSFDTKLFNCMNAIMCLKTSSAHDDVR